MAQNNFEQIFLSCLGSGELLTWELNNDINLVSYLEQKNPQTFSIVIFLLAFVPKKSKQEMFNEITPEGIFDILKRERQDLYRIIIAHPKGNIWVVKQIENFKKRFL